MRRERRVWEEGVRGGCGRRVCEGRVCKGSVCEWSVCEGRKQVIVRCVCVMIDSV